MVELHIELEQTRNEDIIINDQFEFPLAYVGRGTYSGPMKLWSYHTLVYSEEVHLIYIGRYTSIGDNLQIYCDINHDYRSVYMGVISDYADLSAHASFRERMGQAERNMHHKGMIIIGNDVWIGNDVTIISDAVIGNGAVIGAGSVVAHDIPPYTIWCGNPAVKIGERFPLELIRGFQKISWWNYDRKKLIEIEEDMKGEASSFVTKYENASKDLRKAESLYETGDGICNMLTFIDAETNYSVFGNIIEQFCENNLDSNNRLIVCYYKDKEKDSMLADTIAELISTLGEKASICLCGLCNDEDELAISHANYLLLGRDIRNIQRISYAFKYEIKCISGVNKPIF